MADNRTIEVKVRRTTVRGEIIKWEDTPIMWEPYAHNKEHAEECAQQLANDEEKEVRWNWKGDTQGHYHQPEVQQAKMDAKSKRKPHNKLAGYVAELKNRMTGVDYVVIYDRGNGFNADFPHRWIVRCENHAKMESYPSLPVARLAMKWPDFCSDCLAIFNGREAEAATIAERVEFYQRVKETHRDEESIGGRADY